MTALLQAPRVRQSCSGTGTANLNLLAPISSFQGFPDAFPVGSKVTYVLQDGDGVKWEVGKGTLISSTELSRDYVFCSSASSGYQNSGNPEERTKINLSANTHQVFNSIPPELFLFLDDDGALADPTPFRETIFKPTIAAMVAEDLPDTNETVVSIGNASVSDGEGGMFRWDPSDATAPDNIDTFRNSNSSTGLYKRVRLDPVPELVFATTTALRGVDAAAKYKSGRRAVVLGRAAEGDQPAFHVQWDPSSSATHDGAMVFRPTAGAASSGNGRWLRASNTPNQAFTSGDATPSVAGGDVFTTAGTTAITDFDDAYEGQIFVVERGASNIEVTHNASLIDCGGISITLTTAQPRAVFQHVGGVNKLISYPLATGSGWASILQLAVGTTLAIAHTLAKAFWGTLTVDTYANARLLTSCSANVTYKLQGRAARGDGGAGNFYYDSSDNTTADDGGFTTLVTGSGERLKRLFNGPVHSKWGCAANGSTDDTAALNTWLALADNYQLYLDFGRHRFTSALTAVTGSPIFITGAGRDSSFYYDGATATATLLVFGSIGTLRDSIVLRDFAVESNTTMSDGYGLRIYDYQNCDVDVKFEGGKIFKAMRADGCSYVTLNNSKFYSISNGFECNGRASSVDVEVDLGSSESPAVNAGSGIGYLIGGGIGGLDASTAGALFRYRGMQIDNSLARTTVLSCTKNSNTTITGISSTAALRAGMAVTGSGIPAKTYIASVDSGTQITINNAATDSLTSNLTFFNGNTQIFLDRFKPDTCANAAIYLDDDTNRPGGKLLRCDNAFISGTSSGPGLNINAWVNEIDLCNARIGSNSGNGVTVGDTSVTLRAGAGCEIAYNGGYGIAAASAVYINSHAAVENNTSGRYNNVIVTPVHRDSVTIANGANAALPPVSGGIRIANLSNGDNGTYEFGGGGVARIASTSATFVAPTTTPGAGEASIAFDGSSAYRVYNNLGGSRTFDYSIEVCRKSI